MLKGVKDSQGKLVSVFQVSKSRLPSMQDVPTLAEAGVQGDDKLYSVVATSRVIVAPKGVDKGIADLLVTAINKGEADLEFIDQMKKGQFDIAASKPEEISSRMKTAITSLGAIADSVKQYAQ
jgi:tripartite-type tricarboxylate transporter receptor subunit TctC